MVISLAADSAGTVYLGTNDGHLFASEDRGADWDLRGRVGTRTDAVVAQLAAPPMGGRELFAAVWFREAGAGGGVFRSADGGRTWQPSGLEGEAVRALEFAARRANTLVAGTRSGVFRSEDSGRTWERISPAGDPELRNVDSVAMDPANPQIIYAGTYHLPWKTTDGGKSWHSISVGLIDDSDIMSLRVDAANASRVYLSACSGIYRSDNRGDLWTKLQGIPYSARRTQAIVQDPGHPAALYAATTEGLWITRDTGESWERTTPRDWVVNGVVVLPRKEDSPARVIIGTEAQGVLVSEDAGKTFTPSNRGFDHQIVKQLVADSRDAAHLLLLLEPSGGRLLESRDAGSTWVPLHDSAGTRSVVAAWTVDRIDRLYASPWGWMTQLSDGTLWLYSEKSSAWQPWIPIEAAGRVTGAIGTRGSRASRRLRVAPGDALAFSANDTFLPESPGIARCNRIGACALLPGMAQTSKVSSIWASLDGQFLLVSTAGKLALSRDGGRSTVWRDLPAGTRDVNGMWRDSSAESVLFLATERGLYYSRDFAQHWMLSQGGLPQGVIEQVLRGRDYFLATLADGGVYASRDGFGNWSRLDEDGERGRVNGLGETRPGQFIIGSASEGVLRWDNTPASASAGHTQGSSLEPDCREPCKKSRRR